MTAAQLAANIRSARIMARTTDSPAAKLYWLSRAAELSRELSPFAGFEVAKPPRCELANLVPL